MKRAMLLVAGVCLALGPIFGGCGGAGNTSGFASSSSGDDATTDGTSSGSSSGAGGDSSILGDASSGGRDGMSFGDGNSGCPSTCKELGADCGAVTDTKCGGIIHCGSCEGGAICGGGGKPNVCGTGGGNPDGCTKMTCASQHINCGQAGDGCGNMLTCGSCTLPQTCGGDPTKPGQCGCTGVCQMVPTCPTGTTTTLSGTVFDPAGAHPLYDVLVYVPNNPSDPGLQPFPPGITCDVCGATAAGDPLVTAYTAPDGTFTLSGVPVGSSIPLVIQLGRWRRQFTVNIANSCAANSVMSGTLTMPKTHVEGDIPRIALLTGGLDPVECTLRKMGIADSEFTDPGGGGHINFYLATDSDPHGGLQGHGAQISASTPSQPALMTMSTIDQYDMVALECEGYPQHESAADWATLAAYTTAGGRVFSSDFAWSWFYQQTPTAMANPAYANAAVWTGAQWGGGTASNISIDLVSNPKGMAFDKWLEIVGVSVAGSDSIASIYPGFHNTGGVTAPTQQWLYWNAPPQNTSAPLHFSFNTPVGSSSAMQCGRVVYSDWHAWQPGGGGAAWPNGATFPAECDTTPMTPQQAILEFMLFDLSACVQPYKPVCTPTTCAAEKIECGPASDGCGNLLDCGKCAAGSTCGGGGAGKCGTSTTCTPETCMSQGIQCGMAGDGCGNAINCGNCPTGQICGLNGPGKCGMTQ
jgi:hypothetical protein